MEFLSNLILKWLGGSYIKKLLDLLPFNGRKAFLCGVTTALAVLYSAYDNDALKAILEALKQSGGETVLPADQLAMLVGAVMTVLALLHKALKKLELYRDY